MPRFTVVITQTETRTYTLDAPTEDDAIERAAEANENPSGDCPEGFEDYDYSFDSSTDVLP